MAACTPKQANTRVPLHCPDYRNFTDCLMADGRWPLLLCLLAFEGRLAGMSVYPSPCLLVAGCLLNVVYRIFVGWLVVSEAVPDPGHMAQGAVEKQLIQYIYRRRLVGYAFAGKAVNGQM